jgi:heat shock protein HslJ
MDARLRRAGEAWRATTNELVTDPAASEPHNLTPPTAARPRRHRGGLLASAALVAAAFVAGGSILIANITGGNDEHTQPPGQDVTLKNTVWRFLGFGDHLQSSSLATLYISADGQLVADDSCDLIGATVNVNGDQLVISQPEVNYYNCVDSSGEVVFEPDVLTSSPHYALAADGTLTITGAGRTMHLVADPALPVPTLDRPTVTAATWSLVKVTDPNGTDHPVSGDATFRIDNGNLRANDTCNPVSATVTVTGLELDPTNVAIGGSGCLGDVGATAAVVDAVLSHPSRIVLEGTRLTIGLSGAGTLEYEWVPSDTAATDPAKLTDRTWQLTAAAGNPVSDNVALRINSDGTVSAFDGCRKVDASAEVHPGSFSITGIPPADFPATGCNKDLATTVDSLLTMRFALWHIDNGELIMNGPNAQGFALVFQLADPNATPDRPPALTGTSWALVAIKDADGNPVTIGGKPTFQIDAQGHVTGDDGCNTLAGEAQVVDHTIDFTALGGSQMACTGSANTTEEQIHAILSGRVGWSVDGDELTLTKDGAGSLVYRSGDSNQPQFAPLVDTTWQLMTLQSGAGSNGTAASVVTDVTVVFDGAGHVTITHRCYIDRADADTGKGTLDITHKQLQRAVPCPAEPTQQREQDENQVVDHVLSGQATWTIDRGRLTITKDGVGGLVFTS